MSVVYWAKALMHTVFCVVVLATGENLAVRPGKIVAGHEADKTNEWLQALAQAIAQNVRGFYLYLLLCCCYYRTFNVGYTAVLLNLLKLLSRKIPNLYLANCILFKQCSSMHNIHFMKCK